MKKAIVIGCSGSGKSTFARKLQDKTSIPLFYLDMIWHKSDKTTVSRNEFDASLAEILKNDSWIIDGNFKRTLETRLQACDTVFLFDLPADICLEGVRARRGKPRVDMPWIEEYEDEEFMAWIRDFPTSTLPLIYELLEKYKEGREIYIFHSREEADSFLSNM